MTEDSGAEKGQIPSSNTSDGTKSEGTCVNPFRAKVRMYRQGLGDCFLVTLPRNDGSNYFILIDCGVIQGTPNATQKMIAVAADIVATTGGKVDLLLATHEHWDHLSGFIQAADTFKQLSVEKVWLAWTEDPTDELAIKLGREREAALTMLRLSANRMHLLGDEDTAKKLCGFLELFGTVKGVSTKDALEVVRKMTAMPQYCKPQDAPVEVPGLDGVRFFVLGPPRDEKLLKKTLPSTHAPETYGLAFDAFLTQVAPALQEESPGTPFSDLYAIPNHVAQEMTFFQNHYWGREAWRRIDTSWLAGTTELALQLDNATNNTSLVLAIELADHDVLLFAADAQVGNWLSWQDLVWSVGTNVITGPDLLKHTIFYKVGHHGSSNATLQEKGLELMKSLRFAIIPVDEKMAQEKHWGRMPLPALIDALRQKTNGAVLQVDKPAPIGIAQNIIEQDLYFELTLG